MLATAGCSWGGENSKKQKKACLKKAKKKAAKQQKYALNNPSVTIRTTEGGIPRILADNYRGLGYGYGYALAKENICFFEFFLAHFFLAEAGIFTPASAVEATTVNAKDMASRVASRRISFKMLPLRESVCGGLPWPVPSMNSFSLPFGAVWRYAGVFVSDRRVTGRTKSGRALPISHRPGGFALRGSSLKPLGFVVNVFG